MTAQDHRAELGRDVLDPADLRPPRGGWRLGRHPALGIRPTFAPWLLFVAAGAALGPAGLNVLSGAVVDRLDMLVSVALAVFGVFIGLGIGALPRGTATRLLLVGTAGTVASMAIVAAGLGLLLTSWGIPVTVPLLSYVAIVGICASPSAAVHGHADEVLRRAAVLADVDDVPIVLLGAVAIAALAAPDAATMALRLGMTVGAGAAIGIAGWLLFDRADGPAERGVFVTGAVLLAAGGGAYLGTSPILAGAAAALVWVRAPGVADRVTAQDLQVLQHPLLAILLVLAGALVEWSYAVVWTAAAVVLLRMTGKLLVSLVSAPTLQLPAAPLAAALLPPGLLGLALALNVRQVLGADAATVVSVVTMAAAASEIVAVFLPRDAEPTR